MRQIVVVDDKNREMCAIVLAAGQGTRMRSAVPKVMHEVLGRPMVACMVEAVRSTGAAFAVVVVGYGREHVEAYFAQDADVRFAVQAEQLGTAHAASMALPHLEAFSGWVYILNGDVPNLSGALLSQLHEEVMASGAAVGFVTMCPEDPHGYGRVVRDDQGRAVRIVEHRDCNEAELAIGEVNAGVYLVGADFLRDKLSRVAQDNAQGEFYLTDLIAMAAQGSGAHALCVPDARVVNGVNDRSQLSDAQAFARQRVNRAWMERGVTMLHADSTLIEAAVELEPDVHLGPGVHLAGKTHVGRGAVVGAHCVLRDVRVGAGAVLGANCVAQDVEIAEGAHVAPLTHVV